MYSIEPMELSILVTLTLPLLVAALPWFVMCYTDRLADQTFEELARLNAKKFKDIYIQYGICEQRQLRHTLYGVVPAPREVHR